MALTDYLRLLRRRGWIILLMAALVAASALVFSRLQTPVYKSTIYLLVKTSRTDFGLTQSAKQLLRSYVAWLHTGKNAEIVINDPELQLDRTADSLKNDVTISSDDSRFIIQIDVKDPDPKTANKIAEKWAALFVQWRISENADARREDWVTAEVLDAPVISRYRPQTTVNTLAGAILGGLLGGVSIFVLEYIESSVIRSPQDIERVLGLSVLGAIPILETAQASARRRARTSGPPPR